MLDKITKTDAEWRRILTPEQYRVTRQKGAEPAHADGRRKIIGDGVFRCVCCNAPLFSSRDKFSEPEWWPTFRQPIAPDRIATRVDVHRFIVRSEVLCSRCDAHLGYVYEDGRPPTGMRYYINATAVIFSGRYGEPSRPPWSLELLSQLLR
ncbi:MAG: peptide-methionine (R)-S-oxide reductase MsrB [Nitrospiraceae bacterium]|nr:peptide-methionine (R)-S-oxide reductase MsrB [Nitrospiraceae bacterium]